jgi:hypothetical protein
VIDRLQRELFCVSIVEIKFRRSRRELARAFYDSAVTPLRWHYMLNLVERTPMR